MKKTEKNQQKLITIVQPSSPESYSTTGSDKKFILKKPLKREITIGNVLEIFKSILKTIQSILSEDQLWGYLEKISGSDIERPIFELPDRVFGKGADINEKILAIS